MLVLGSCEAVVSPASAVACADKIAQSWNWRRNTGNAVLGRKWTAQPARDVREHYEDSGQLDWVFQTTGRFWTLGACVCGAPLPLTVLMTSAGLARPALL